MRVRVPVLCFSLPPSLTPPSLCFSQVPERLGRWRDDFGNLEAAGTDNNGVTKGQWVPEAVVKRKEKEQRQKEEKARRDGKHCCTRERACGC